MQIMHGLHKLIVPTSKMSERARCALVEGNCFLFYLIIILRKGNQTRLNCSVKSLNFSVQCSLYSPVSLFMVLEERYNLCMNRASLDRVP